MAPVSIFTCDEPVRHRYSLVRRTGYHSSKTIFTAETHGECKSYLENLLVAGRGVLDRSNYNILPFVKEGDFGEGIYG